MRKIYLTCALCFTVILASSIYAQENKTGDDEWEMKQYFFVFLNSTAERPKMDSVKVAELQAAHLGHIDQMFKDGKCRLAGPFLEKGEMRGIWILDVATREEAEKLCSEDPFIINGFLTAAIKPWYGPAGLYVQPKAK
jgi:uncharacterized protein